MHPSNGKIVYFVAVDWFFCSHFMERAIAAQKAGYDVIVMTYLDRHAETIAQAGLKAVHLPMNRRSLSPWSALVTSMHVYRVYRRERPVLVHQVALKPILLGALAAKFARIPCVLNAVVGGGYLFTSKRRLVRLVRPILEYALRKLLSPRSSWVVFENSDDLDSFVQRGLVQSSRAMLIRGAGVVPEQYSQPLIVVPPVVVLAARLLWDKGIGEFVEAAHILRAMGMHVRFQVVGDVDTGNRASIDPKTLALWREGQVVEFLGFRSDMPEILKQATIACLPSYREGLPKFLLEAMASSLPCVTTDVPGCREAVSHGDNGLLVPPRDAPALANALNTLLQDPALARQMGKRGRERLEGEFSSAIVIKQTLTLYRDMIGA